MPGDLTPTSAFVPRQFAIIADGLVVATCESSRESLVAAEAWVRTLPQYRRRGYATRVTAAWARDARRRNKEPFYSHHRENAASESVARALRLLPFLEDAGYL
jgi:predicted GNAT family acetyltransferase